MSASTLEKSGPSAARGGFVYKQTIWTRVTHWSWAVALLFLMMSGLMIFNAHPNLYIGNESGFEYDNAVLQIGAVSSPDGLEGQTIILGKKFDTTGVLGVSGAPAGAIAFPSWATIPSYYDLGTARVIHFFFAWVLAAALTVWLISSVATGHAWRDLIPKPRDIQNLPRDVIDHVKLKFHHAREYNVLQKLAYFSVLFLMLPLMIATGLAMSPGANAIFPWLPELLGGRQTARTIHFAVMVLLFGFFVVHMLMILAAGPFNELRSIITGWYRVDRQEDQP